MASDVFLPQEVIRRKRDCKELTEEEISGFVTGLADGTISEGQVSAFAMSVFFNGMSPKDVRCPDACNAGFWGGAELGSRSPAGACCR